MFVVPLTLLSLCSCFAAIYAAADHNPIFKNTTAVVTVNTTNESQLGFTNSWGLIGEYTATVYIQGQPFQVIIDTGSSDLWIYNSQNLTLDGLIPTGHSRSDTYDDGTYIDGPIVLANISLGQYTVQAQAFINSESAAAEFGSSADGILGVSSPFVSPILEELYSNSPDNGWPFLSNLFNNNPDMEPYITLYLTRSSVGVVDGGALTISEIVTNFEAVLEAPPLPVYSDNAFSTFMDGVYLDGKFLTGNSFGPNGTGVNANPGPNQTIVLLDSGTSLMIAPPYYVDGIYKDIPGAQWIPSMKTYSVPCSTKLNISMVFGESIYAVDPLDSTHVDVSDDGSFTCIGAISYSSASGGVDFILGSSFLRNVYTLFHWGNWTENRTNQPYMQLLSLTDPDKAWANFDTLNLERIGQIQQQQIQDNQNYTYPKTVSQSVTYSLTSPSLSATHSAGASSTSGPSASTLSPSTASTTTPAAAAKLDAALAEASGGVSSSSTVDLGGLTRNSYIIMGLIAGVLVLLLGVLSKLVSDGRNQQYRAVPNVVRPPMHFSDKPYEPESETFVTPYDDPARPH
ncbi:acid protease [Sparassis crispa]|uniref:Acid protease n=1 Tax=Sparassis crispa TaxID=139825 RepID=A0A401H1M1_9APHY|nr:acid protease [Sparassis crispa]GBE88337.1 acid protease [Sparassis crispa]